MEINMSYEEAIERLEEILGLLEKNEVSLDEALKLYEEGTALTSFCSSKLNNAKMKIMEIEKE